MRIGIIGTRGIPNRYGGFEQFAEFVAPALVKRGHSVSVYNSSLHPYKEKNWKGVNRITKYDPENRIGTAGQFVYDLNCILDSRKRGFDIILQLGYTSSSIWSSLFPASSILITNMDGLEWKRSKYSRPVQNFLRKAEKWAALHSDFLIADSKGIQEYLLRKYQKPSCFIAYGADLAKQIDESWLHQRQMAKFEYDLVIARLEPENNVETIIRGHLISGSKIPLVIIGGTNHKYGASLKQQYASEQIQFWGTIYDMQMLNSFRHFSRFYFHGHSVGGTNPSLLEAMACYAMIVANDNVFNRSVLEDDAFYFSSSEDIASLLDRKIDRTEFEYMVTNNAVKITEQYSWDHIVNLLENYLLHAMEESTVGAS
mgnify:CR=1 FL=1